MFTIYVRSLAAFCALSIAISTVPARADTTAGGGSGGLSEVQNRLQGLTQDCPEIVEAKRKLVAVARARTEGRDSDGWALLANDAGARPGYALEVQAADVVQALDELTSFLQNGGSPAQAKSALRAIAQPENMEIGSSSLQALLQTMAYKSPAKYVSAVLSGERLQLPANYKTTDLQRLYDRLTGSEKPLTILKNDREFLMVRSSGICELFADDTQFIVHETTVDAKAFAPAVVKDDGYGAVLSAENVRRQIILNGDYVVERTTVTNGGSVEKKFVIEDRFNSDFKDMFEVRGWKRAARGQLLPREFNRNNLKLSYRGLDGAVVSTTIMPAATSGLSLSESGVTFARTLAPHSSASYELAIIPSGSLSAGKQLQTSGRAAPAPRHILTSYAATKRLVDAEYLKWRAQGAGIETDNPDWNRMLERAYKDLYMLRQRTSGGAAIAAGTPWFAAPFGRDQLVTSIQLLAARPDLAKNVLRLLAFYQGKQQDAYRAEKPGKIMHELRIGEMARNKEIPFTPYYGTVDATPLWVVLLGRYYERTGDIQLVRELKPNLDRALDFLRTETASTSYLRYGGGGKEALSNQGWKDSGDSVAYSTGQLAKAPIALSEVQGYLYDSWKQASALKKALGNSKEAVELEKRASTLCTNFNRDFWMPKEGFVALALDGDLKQVDVVSSNPGHLLTSGLLGLKEFGVAQRLMQPDMYSGFGIRTLSANAKRYFPNSYHNGSVWPHDVSLIAQGLHRTNWHATAQLADSMLNAARYQNDFRLPELFGGYARAEQTVPIPYPVACEPQAWAAGTPFMLLTSCSGLAIEATRNTVVLAHPELPSSINRLTIKNLPVRNGARLSLQLKRIGSKTEVQVLENRSKLSLSVIK